MKPTVYIINKEHAFYLFQSSQYTYVLCISAIRLTITHMMYRFVYRYRKNYHFLENQYFFWLFEPDSRSEPEYFGKIIDSLHTYHLAYWTECPGGEFKI